MLPLLRIIPVGGVFFAITIVILALNPPGDPHAGRSQAQAVARGALVDAAAHPEWRHFLLHAAIRRADELERLRDLPDTPARIPEAAIEVPPPGVAAPVAAAPAELPMPEPMAEPSVAEAPVAVTIEAPVTVSGLPIDRIDAEPEIETGSIAAMPEASIPIDIGVTSATELPVAAEPEMLPAILPPTLLPPQRAKPLNETRSKPVRRIRRARAAPKPPPPPTNIFEILFGPLQPQNQASNAGPPADAGSGPSVATQR